MKFLRPRAPSWIKPITYGLAACGLSTALWTGSLIIAAAAHSAPLPQVQDNDSKSLDKVLAQMDRSAADFRTTQAKFVWENYQKIVDDKDVQKGTVYYRRQGKEIEMLADLTSNPPKKVLFAGGKVHVLDLRTRQATTYEAGKNRETVETFLVLGFGGSGRELRQSFDVKYLGPETIDGVNTAKLELVPKSDRVRDLYGRIWLWIDPARGISLQQQFFDLKSGDYRLARYQDIEVNQKIPDSVFKLPSDTKYIAPKG